MTAPKLARYRAAVTAAEAESARLYEEWRAAHRRFFDADMRLLHARLDLEDAIAEKARNRKDRP
ncbi:MAG TPA: hypothetical protein DHW40_11065 [Microbacterium sp.]|nr:hypothetical protein [Microbacterium sp.]